MATTTRWAVRPRSRGDAAPGPIPPCDRLSGPRPVAIGATCDLLATSRGSLDCQSFSVTEFLILEDGDRVTLRDDLGFTIGSPFGDVHDGLSADDIVRAVLTVVQPEDHTDREDHPWESLVMLARRRRILTCPDELSRLPYEVTLTDSVRRWL